MSARPRSLRRNLMAFFISVLLISFSVGVYNVLYYQFSLQEMSRLMTTSRQLWETQKNLNALKADVDQYLYSRNSTALQSYYDNYNLVLNDGTALVTSVEYTSHGVKMKNLGNLLYHLLEKGEETVSAKRNEQTQTYIHLHEEVEKEHRYISEYIQEIMTTDLKDNAVLYERMRSKNQMRMTLSFVLFLSVILCLLYIVFLYTKQITRPISQLADYADGAAEGNYGIAVDTRQPSVEFSRLYNAFGIMLEKTRLYLDSLKEKQMLERELADQQIKSLTMSNALHAAELKALHAQMNPHFIFNTINIGAKIAMMQGDDVVCDYLENAADVFRYNLAGLNNASLEEEMSNVTSYMKLLSTRFGNMLHYEMLDKREEKAICILPRMTLQPLVENAFLHGVSQSESGGSIRVEIENEGENVRVMIGNTGSGFPPEKIKEILSEPDMKFLPPIDKGHVSGIGLSNVIKRLRLHFNMDNPLDIVVSDGWTRVILILPTALDKEEAV